MFILSKSQGKEKPPSECGTGCFYLPLRVLNENETALPAVGRASYCLAGERLLVSCYALEAVGDVEIPLDQAADLFDHQVGIFREGVQHILESLKSWQRVQKVFHKLLLLLP